MADDRVPAAKAESAVQPLVTFVLALCFAIAFFAIAAPIVLLNTDYTVMAEPFLPHKQNAETALYVLTILVFGPGAWLLAHRLVRALAAGPNAGGLTGLAALLAVPLGFGLLLVRHSAGLPWGDGLKATLVLGAVWAVIAGALIVACLRGGPSIGERLRAFERPLVWLAGLATAAGVLAIVRLGHLDAIPLALALVAAAGVLLLYPRIALPRLSRPWRIGIDLVALGLIVLAVPDMVILRDGSGDFDTAYRTSVSQFHQALFVGAASQVLDGSALLVDTVSQYGIGSIYLVAAWFEIVPIGFLTLGLLEGILSAITFALAYGVLRMSGVTRPLAAGAMALAVITLAWGLLYPLGALLQHGAIRFGLPMLLIAAAVAAARWPGHRRWLVWVGLAVTGLSSLWALEALIYTCGAVAGLILVALPWQEPGRRLRWLVRAVGAVLASWVVAQVLFALVTLVASGSLPDWGLYITYLREFLTGDIGDLTYDVTRWSPGLGVFAVYVASGIALATLAVDRTEFTAARRPAFLALAGLTGYGVTLYSYFVNRSLDHILLYECLPALLVVTIWLSLALAPASGLPVRVRSVSLAGVLALAAIVLSTTWATSVRNGEDSMLAYAVPGGKTLKGGFDRIFDPPPFKPGAAAGEELIDQYVPGDDPVAVVTVPDLDVEILARAGRSNRLRITDAKEASWVPEPHLPGLEEAVAGLEPGDPMIVDQSALNAFRIVEEDPAAAFAEPRPAAVEAGLEEIQIRALALIAERFELRRVASGGDGIELLELVPLRP